jgi:hypothetical protein
MTTCTPIRPFRCWQYRKDSTEPVPEWIGSYPLRDHMRCFGNPANCSKSKSRYGMAGDSSRTAR